jgi:alkanesulfonate monooxygenase SsuD/methylene tetrahydromethanopterin reductase-like flavin-dependent oxidoreductase (luciferase family)
LLDEGLDIITGLRSGQPFNYDGQHYTIRETTFQPAPPPVQKPRIPVWVVGACASVRYV